MSRRKQQKPQQMQEGKNILCSGIELSRLAITKNKVNFFQQLETKEPTISAIASLPALKSASEVNDDLIYPGSINETSDKSAAINTNKIDKLFTGQMSQARENDNISMTSVCWDEKCDSVEMESDDKTEPFEHQDIEEESTQDACLIQNEKTSVTPTADLPNGHPNEVVMEELDRPLLAGDNTDSDENADVSGNLCIAEDLEDSPDTRENIDSEDVHSCNSINNKLFDSAGRLDHKKNEEEEEEDERKTMVENVLKPNDTATIRPKLNEQRKISQEGEFIKNTNQEGKPSEIQLIKEELNRLQQQNQYQMQLIQVLQWQISSTLHQQRQLNFDSQSSSLHPLSQFLNNGGGTLPNPMSLAAVTAAMALNARNTLDPTNLIRPANPSIQLGDSYYGQGSTEHHISEQSLRNSSNLQNPDFQIDQRHGLFDQSRNSATSSTMSEQLATAAVYHAAQMQFRAKAEQINRDSLKSGSTLGSQQHSNESLRPGDVPGQEKPFLKNQCRTCFRILSCPSALKLHYRTHTGERPYACDKCDRAFTTRGNLRTHYSSVHGEELPPANAHSATSNGRRQNANKANTSVNKTKMNHQSLHDQQARTNSITDRRDATLRGIVRSEEQSQQISSGKFLVPDIQSSTKQDFPFKKSPSPNEQEKNYLLQQKTKYQDFNAFSTSVNPREIEEKQDSIAASSALDLSTTQPYKNNFNEEERRKRNSSEVSESRKSALSLCDENSKENEEPNNMEHDQKFQAMVQPIQSLNRPSTLTDSISSDVPDKPVYFPCGICLHRFRTREELQEHILTRHESLAENSFSAETDAAERRHVLKRHLDYDTSTHSEGPDSKRSYPRHWCHICQKQFSSASSLQIHTRTHTGEKPFLCHVCQRAFTTKGNLKVHMGTHAWGAGGSKKGRRVSMDNPEISSWMKNSTNVGDVAATRRYPENASNHPTYTKEAIETLFQRYALAVGNGMIKKGQHGEINTANPHQMLNFNLAAANYFQQSQGLPPSDGSASNDASPEGRTETSLSSDGELETAEAVNEKNEWSWKSCPRSENQVN